MNYLQASRAQVDGLPQLRLSRAQFMALPEYSVTNPDGVFVGKLWRARTTCGRWIVRGYLEHPTDARKCLIEAWRPFLSVAGSAFVDECAAKYKADVQHTYRS